MIATNLQPLGRREFARLHGTREDTRRRYYDHIRKRIAEGKYVDPEDRYALKLSDRAKNRRRK